MARLTKRQEGETVKVFYGINPNTFEVESVYRTRDNVLSKTNRSGVAATHPVLFGRDPKIEIVIVWHLTDIISFPPVLLDSEFAKKAIEELEQKAAAKKKAAEAKAGED